MDGWTIAAALFAAGAFALGLLAEWRRWQSRPTWAWSVAIDSLVADPTRRRVTLQLMADAPAHHVTIEGVGIDLWDGHHDHDHDRHRWPHESLVSPSDPPLILYLQDDGSSADPYLRISWQVPPTRANRFMRQDIPIRSDAPTGRPYPLWAPRPWERRRWHAQWAAARRRFLQRWHRVTRRS